MSDTIGFIGLGKLGLPMATNLLKVGYALKVYNRTASKADPLVAEGAELARRPADVATRGGVVASIVWDDASLESIVTSEGFLETLGQGGVHVGMATVSPDISRKMTAIHARHGVAYIAAPIFGRPEAAVARQLWVPFAGPEAAKARVRPLLEAMGAQGIFDFGDDPGASVLVKLIGNYLFFSAGHSIQEALAIATKAGVDPNAVVEMLTSTLLNAPIYQSYGKRIAEDGKLNFQSAIPRKDIGLFQITAQQVESPTPIANLLSDLLHA